MTRITQIYAVFFLLIACFFLFACDSGDIYPENSVERNDNISVAADFTLTGLADTRNYELYFAAFEGENRAPLVWTKIIPESEANAIHVSLDNVPAQADNVQLCLLSIGRRAIYSFFSYDISNTQNNIEIPLTDISLKMEYDKIQDLFERNTCTACHGSENGAAGLLLGAGKSYENLVDHPSINSAKRRVEPFNIENSFLIEVLTSDKLSLRHPHSTIMYNQDDLNLLKAWIERGANE
jgi:hypothetical protein